MKNVLELKYNTKTRKRKAPERRGWTYHNFLIRKRLPVIRSQLAHSIHIPQGSYRGDEELLAAFLVVKSEQTCIYSGGSW